MKCRGAEAHLAVARDEARAEHLVVREIDRRRVAPVGHGRVVLERPAGGEHGVGLAEHLDADLVGRPHLLGDELRPIDRDQRGAAVIDVPDTVRREKLPDAHAEHLVALPLDVRTLEDEGAEAHLVVPGAVRGIGDRRRRGGLVRRDAGDADRLGTLRVVGEARLDERAPVGERMEVEVEIDVAEHERRRARRDHRIVRGPQLLEPHVDEAVEPHHGLLDVDGIGGRRRGGVVGGAQLDDLALEIVDAILQGSRRRCGRRERGCGRWGHGCGRRGHGCVVGGRPGGMPHERETDRDTHEPLHGERIDRPGRSKSPPVVRRTVDVLADAFAQPGSSPSRPPSSSCSDVRSPACMSRSNTCVLLILEEADVRTQIARRHRSPRARASISASARTIAP